MHVEALLSELVTPHGARTPGSPRSGAATLRVVTALWRSCLERSCGVSHQADPLFDPVGLGHRRAAYSGLVTLTWV